MDTGNSAVKACWGAGQGQGGEGQWRKKGTSVILSRIKIKIGEIYYSLKLSCSMGFL